MLGWNSLCLICTEKGIYWIILPPKFKVPYVIFEAFIGRARLQKLVCQSLDEEILSLGTFRGTSFKHTLMPKLADWGQPLHFF